MRTIEDAQKFITTKMNEAKEKKEVWEGLLQSAEKAKAEAATEAAKTYEAADPKAYHKAQDAFRTAQDAISMYKDKIAALEAEAMITEEEYKGIHDDIVSALDEINSDAKKRICTIVDEQIAPIADEVTENIEQANDLLVTLQIELLKDHRAEEIPSLQNKYTDHSVSGFLRTITSSNLYKEGSDNNELS